ncbi:hypothetical protein ACFL2O_06085 [Thermodesulfobacteriota bacterium]
MRIALRIVLLGVVLLLSLSCAQVARETVSPVTPSPADGQVKKVVILPFADYTEVTSPYRHWRRNTLVLEAIQDEFYRAGYISEVEEDVVRYLISQGVINSADEIWKDTASLDREMDENWSEEMKEEIQRVILEAVAAKEARKKYGASQQLIALDTEMIKRIGSVFGADYIVRGRIVEFRSGQEDTYNPFKTGIVSFIFKTGNRMSFGHSEADLYEMISKAGAGAAGASVMAFQFTNHAWPVHTAAWGAVGAGVGYLAHKGGRVPDATVQVRALVQDARTGEVIWSNRAETRTVPLTAFAEQDRNILFAKSIHETAKSLVENFVTTLETGMVPEIRRVVSQEEIEMKAKEAHELQEAAEEAKKAAYKAKMAAEEAEDSAVRAEEAEDGARKSSEKSEKIFKKTTKK